MKAKYPTLSEIITAVKEIIQIELEPIRADIQKINENMVTKADLADLIIDFDHMKREQSLYDVGLKGLDSRVTRLEEK